MPPLIVENLEALKDLVGREFAITDWFEVAQERITPVRRSHRRSPVDPSRLRSRAKRFALRHNHRAWLPDPVLAEPFLQAGPPDPKRCRHDHQLRIESRPLFRTGPGRIQYPRSLHSAIFEGCRKFQRSGVFGCDRSSEPIEASLLGGVGNPYLPLADLPESCCWAVILSPALAGKINKKIRPQRSARRNRIPGKIRNSRRSQYRHHR